MRSQQSKGSFERSNTRPDVSPARRARRTNSTSARERRAFAKLSALSGKARDTVPAFRLARALGLTLVELVPTLRALAAQGLAEQRPAGWAPKAGAA